MGALRYLYRCINLLNILLLMMTVSVVVFALSPQFRMKIKYTLPVGKTKVAEEVAPSKEPVQGMSPADYVVVSENNLFHPDRRIPPEKKDEKLLPKPDLVLFGTVISGDVSVAYIEDKKSPKASPGRGKRQSVVKKGDVLGGFIIKDIETDRIILSRGEETMVVRLTEAGKQRESATGSLPGIPQTAKPGSAASQSTPGSMPSSAIPNPLAGRASATPVVPPTPTITPSTQPPRPGLSSRQQRLQEVQQLKAARPTGP